jgi:[ribosomal protein S18]-alanine N-acetyltransferase
MNYHLYQPADFAHLYAVEELCFDAPFRFSRALMRKLIANPNSATWIAETSIAEEKSAKEKIAEENKKLAGFAIVDWATVPKGTVAYIQTIEVNPGSRRQGIASELLRLSEVSALVVGATAIWLHVDVENAAAMHLYEGRGYARKGREEHFYARNRAAFIYAKSLAAAPGAKPPS